MKTEKIRAKMKKSSKTAAGISKFVGIIGIIGIVCIIIYTAMYFVRGDSLASPISEIDGTSLTVENFEINTIADMVAAFSSVVVDIALFSTIAFIASAMLNRIHKDGRPFSEENIKNLRTIGELIMLDSFAPAVISSVVGIVLNIVEKTGNASVMLNVDIDIILIGALFFLLATIFAYGAQLQQESDETI